MFGVIKMGYIKIDIGDVFQSKKTGNVYMRIKEREGSMYEDSMYYYRVLVIKSKSKGMIGRKMYITSLNAYVKLNLTERQLKVLKI